MRIIIKGKPKYQKRHRHGNGRTWNPSSNDKKTIKLSAQSQINQKPYDIPLQVEITAYYPFLKSWSKKERAISEGAPKITKPDADNIAKLYGDALNGVAWTDDNIITELTVRKLYSREPCVVIEVDPYEV
jgi:Holliday junction resolvase RusA-like endonuclease